MIKTLDKCWDKCLLKNSLYNIFLMSNVPYNLLDPDPKSLTSKLANNFFHKHVLVFTNWGPVS